MAMSDAERQRKRWARRTPEEIAARKEYKRIYWQNYGAERKQERAARWRSWWSSLTPGQKAVESVKGRARKYNISPTVIHEMLAGGCQFPEGDHQGPLHIDHDHACCAGRRSCGQCVRGILCARHNLLIGQFEKISPHLVWVISYMAKVREEDTK
jgi:hypothetical protein